MMGKDKSGQVMLISAFMLAIVVVAITLMLNNVIYSSNMAYVGYMDQSRYDDLSYKQATADEAAYAYYAYVGDSAKYNTYMGDYEKCLNNLSSAKGGYIELTSNTAPATNPLLTTDTESHLSIYGKNSKTSYDIYTGSSNTAPPAPTATPLPTSYQLLLTAVPSSFEYGDTDGSDLSVRVTSGGAAQPNVSVLFSLSNTSLGDVMCIDGVSHIPASGLISDQDGYVYAKFVGTLFAGTETIRAYNGSKNLSNIAVITITQPATCTHNVPYGPAELNPTGGSGKVDITVPIDLSSFTNGDITIYTPDLSSNIQQSGSTPAYVHNKITYTIKRLDNNPYTVTLKFRITATCNIDHQPYDRTITYVINGP
jgi:hypothetical protein